MKLVCCLIAVNITCIYSLHCYVGSTNGDSIHIVQCNPGVSFCRLRYDLPNRNDIDASCDFERECSKEGSIEHTNSRGKKYGQYCCILEVCNTIPNADSDESSPY